jgi:hypothetical protein
MSILDAVRGFLKGLGAALGSPPVPDSADEFLADLFDRFPFAGPAQNWLRENVRVELWDRASTQGGGTWHPDLSTVRLHTAQYEAAIHELAHALWEGRRRDRRVRDELVAAVQRLAEDPDPRWERVRALAGHYVHGIAEQPGFEQGMLLPASEWGRGGGPRGEWNDWEMYAGLASGCMADVRLLPPYLRRFYAGVFDELPPGVPSPERLAPHR